SQEPERNTERSGVQWAGHRCKACGINTECVLMQQVCPAPFRLIQQTRCDLLPYRQMRPEVARDALSATHSGLSLERCAVLYHISPMAFFRLICPFGPPSPVTVLIRCRLPLPTYFLADEKHSHCLTDKAYLPTILRGRVLWHLGYTTEASATAFTQSYQEF